MNTRKKKSEKIDNIKANEENIKEMEREQAKEELHQAELAMGYEQDEKYEESED